jgi:D-alanyl-D-alanine carboxypeptidase
MLPSRVRNQRSRRWGALTLVSLLAAALVTSAADARSRHRRSSYNPPYASIVVDANSGKVMAAENADSRRHPASLTKIMTLYLLFEQLEAGKIKLSTELPVSAHAAAQAPSKLGLKPGQTIDVGTAISAIVTKSANDVAVIVAEALGNGSETEFAKAMTAKAHVLGMSHTVYVNASGLPDDRQVTTARDQSILGRAIQDRFPKYFHYFSTREFVFRGKRMRNHNHLLGRINGVDGIKTGYIRESGFNIVVSVHRSGRNLIAVMFGGRSGSARDARVSSLIANNINVASAKRTAPKVVEGWMTAIARKGVPTPPAKPAIEPAQKVAEKSAKPVIKPAAEPVKSIAEAPTRASPETKVVVAPPLPPIPAPEPGSTDPIRPIFVKTVTVQPGLTRAASLSPLPADSRKLTPAPATATAAKITMIATVPGKQPPPAKPVPIAETKVASADDSVPVKAATPKSAPKAHEPAAKPHGGWMIQVGAFDVEKDAKERLTLAQEKAKALLGSANPFTEPVAKGDKTLYRARFAGLERSKAQSACHHLKRSDIPCILLKN